MLVYKSALNDKTRVLITLEIPDDAKNNFNRSNIVDKTKASYRANKVKVLKIEDAEGNEYETAESAFNSYDTITYVNNKIIETDFDDNLQEVCTTGIHFFLDKDVALLYWGDKVENGLYQSWYNNGQKWIKSNFVNGELHGLYQNWHENGQKKIEANYINGERSSIYQE